MRHLYPTLFTNTDTILKTSSLCLSLVQSDPSPIRLIGMFLFHVQDLCILEATRPMFFSFYKDIGSSLIYREIYINIIQMVVRLVIFNLAIMLMGSLEFLLLCLNPIHTATFSLLMDAICQLVYSIPRNYPILV